MISDEDKISEVEFRLDGITCRQVIASPIISAKDTASPLWMICGKPAFIIQLISNYNTPLCRECYKGLSKR